MKTIILLLMILMSNLAQAELSNESELGIASANGNTKTQTYNLKQSNDYKWNLNIALAPN